MGRLLTSWPAHGEKKGGRGMGMGQCMCCVHRTLCLGLPHPSPSAHCACNLLWGWAAAPDLCALQDMCTCLFGLLILVPGCSVYQADKKKTKDDCSMPKYLLPLRAGMGLPNCVWPA